MGSVRVTSVGGKRLAADLARASAEVDQELRHALGRSGQAAVFLFRGRAPQRTGRLRKGIKHRFVSGTVVQVEAHANDPATGYSYVAVTRFGHRVHRIVARNAKALKFTIGGRTLFRKSVRGYHPAQDWAEGAMPEVVRVVQREGFEAAQRLARRVG